MSFNEFCDRVKNYDNKTILPTVPEYEMIIEPVYMWHPADISKEDMTEIYCMSDGLRIFKSLLPDAIKVRDIKNRMERIQEECDKELETLQDQLDNLMEG